MIDMTAAYGAVGLFLGLFFAVLARYCSRRGEEGDAFLAITFTLLALLLVGATVFNFAHVHP